MTFALSSVARIIYNEMMGSTAFTSAIAGINAGFTQLGVSADNVARRNVPYAEKNRVIQNSRPNGGIDTEIQAVPIPPEERLDSTALEYSTSNIDYAEEAVHMMMGKLATRVSLRVFDTAEKMEESILDIHV